jgi:hypothetical protein
MRVARTKFAQRTPARESQKALNELAANQALSESPDRFVRRCSNRIHCQSKRCVMLISSRYLQTGAPTCCQYCKAPFPIKDGHAEAWRDSFGRYFCSEFCADDAAEAAFRQRRAS